MLRNIGFLIFPDFNLLDLSGPLSVFETANNYLELENQYVLEIISVKEGVIESSIGATLHAGSAEGKVFDVLIVPGGRGVDTASLDPEILALFKRDIASRYVSVCTGAFLLAASGKLSQKKATTHWARAAELKRLHTDIMLQPDEIVVEDGDVWSSAGATAGMDIALALVESEHGKTLTHLVSRILLIPHRRTRGQLQYVKMQAITPPPPRLQKILEFISLNLQEDLSVSALAERAFLSARQLSREFITYTGLSPARAVESIRVEFARSKIENTNLPLSSIAKESGFQSLAHMRKAFVRTFNISPRNLRTHM
ncbi:MULTISPECIES: DJ-1/PfpI family protein [unclassified Pantoea]|uniref:GlxA family transcriptional regulator n=1 Tax=unclassified Pantoea TaxID=2630326 RepID=UPI0024AECBAA|nr:MULTISPECIES: DJ-1/PfpI family protein [unclassified Pantoea]MDI6958444.1 DJ-1/PfpI family protein [Pantoea sp. Pa-EAmG]MDI9221369.1 DJ-1/PfpI family protein [Pantoea sp. EA-12]